MTCIIHSFQQLNALLTAWRFLIIFASFNFILLQIWTFQIYGIDNSILFNQFQDMLKQKYVSDIYTNSSCNPGDQEVYYKVPETQDGCKCQEQLYTKNCTKQQKDSQNCTQINSYNSIILSQWPFQLENNFSYAQKICLVKSQTSLYDQIIQNNNCSANQKQCGEGTNYLCGEICPISHFQINQQVVISKQNRQKTIIRIDNVQRNISEPLIGLNVTNGNCYTLRNSSNYTLKKQEETNCQFKQLMVSIIEYQASQILKVNQKYVEYRYTRKFDILNNQSYIINGLRQFYVAPQCRLKNKILDPFQDLQKTEIIILCTLIVFSIFQIINLFILYSFIKQKEQQHKLKTTGFNIFYTCYSILIFILLVISIVYYIQISNDCWDLELERVNLIIPLITIIFTFIQLARFFMNIYKIQHPAKVFPSETQNGTSLSNMLNEISVSQLQSNEKQDSALIKTDGDIVSPIQSTHNQQQQLKKPKQEMRKTCRQVVPQDIEMEQEENQFNRARRLSL